MSAAPAAALPMTAAERATLEALARSRSVSQRTCGHRSRTGDPLHGVRRTLHARLPPLSSRPQARLVAVFDGDDHLAVAV